MWFIVDNLKACQRSRFTFLRLSTLSDEYLFKYIPSSMLSVDKRQDKVLRFISVPGGIRYFLTF